MRMGSASLRKKILIADSEHLACQTIAASFSSTFEVFTAANIADARTIAQKQNIDAIIIDLHLGHENGLDLCEHIRHNSKLSAIPIIVTTRYADKHKLLISYQRGADDFVEKPVDVDILKTKILSLMKRFSQIRGDIESMGNLTAFYERSEIELNGEVRRLSQLEMKILRYFLSNPQKKIQRQELLDTIWPDHTVEQRTIDVHVSLLRKKLKDFDFSIDSIYAGGYILRPSEKKLDKILP